MSATWLLALGETFKAVRDEPRPYRMARRYVPRFAGQKTGGHGASVAAGEGSGWPGGPAAELSETEGGAGRTAAV